MAAGMILVHCEELPPAGPDAEDLDLYTLYISPPYPDSEDVIQLIEKTCGIEPDPIVDVHGNQITYLRHFNSLMGAPCIPTMDTTMLGPLPSGSYQLVHWVVDKNHMLSDSVFSLDTIPLVVK